MTLTLTPGEALALIGILDGRYPRQMPEIRAKLQAIADSAAPTFEHAGEVESVPQQKNGSGGASTPDRSLTTHHDCEGVE